MALSAYGVNYGAGTVQKMMKSAGMTSAPHATLVQGTSGQMTPPFARTPGYGLLCHVTRIWGEKAMV